MKTQWTKTPVALALAAALAGPVMAQEPCNPAMSAECEATDIERAQAVLTSVLALFPQAAEGVPGIEYGEPVIEADGSSFVATLPELAYVAEGTRAAFGDAKIRIDLLDNARAMLTDTSITQVDITSDGAPTATITIDGYADSLTWDGSLGSLSEMTVNMNQLTVALPEQPEPTATISSVQLSQNVEVQDDGDWRQVGKWSSGAIAFNGPMPVTVGGLTGDYVSSGNEWDTLMTLSEELRDPAVAKAMADAQSAGDTAVMAEMMGRYGELMALITQVGGSIKLDQIQVGGAEAPMLSANYLAITGGLEDDQSASSAINYAIDYNGLNAPAAPLPPGMLPTEGRLDIRVSELPANLLGQMMGFAQQMAMMEAQQAESPDAGPSSSDMAGLMVMQMFATAPIRVEIVDSRLIAEQARVDLTMDMRRDMTSPLQAVGTFEGTITGLPNVVASMGEAATQEGPAQAIAMLQMFSERTEENGQTVDRYAVQITPDGKLMLNGKDMTAMVMPQQGAQPMPEPMPEEGTEGEAPAE